MTVLVGYLAGKCGHAPLNLAVEAARLLNTSLAVVAVVPKPWSTPSPARVDAEFANYAEKLGSESRAEAQTYLSEVAADLDVSYLQVSSRTAGDGLLEAVTQVGADLLVVGSSSDGGLGQVVLGSTTDWLLHSCPVPMALSPRGYRGVRSGTLTRITCAHSGTPDSARVIQRLAELTAGMDITLRVVSFAIRGRTMFPPVVGLQTEDSLLDTWAAQLQDTLNSLRTDGIVSDDVELKVITGEGWDQALDATDWEEGDLLALGTTPRRRIKSVFLGSHSAKIIRYSPVPVLVLPS